MKTVKTFGFFKKTLKTVAVLFTAGLLISFLYSCEIGLGGAVDTQPPTIKITNPPVDSVIRDNFALCGTYDDDGTIKSVSAVLTRPDKKGKDIELTEFTLTGDANIKGAGTWTIPVNALDAQGTKLIDDGTYQATISIKDAAGRVTTQSTTFTVDNTAPVLILQRPATDVSVINEDDIDTFGKTFTLEGRAADDNNIDHIDIKIFSDPQKTDLIHTVTLQNVPLSIALDVAKWGEEDQNYEKIYGSSTQEGAKKRYCSIEAYDSAQRYPADGTEQTAEDKNGNFTNEYYLYNDIAGSSIAKYKVTELYSIMSGNYSSDGRSATDTIASVKTVLGSLKKDSGCFKLNPLNNPTYKLSGWTSTEDFVTFEESSITLDVEPGLDGIAVDKTTLKPYLIKIDDSGNPVSGKIYPDSEDVKITGASSYKIAVKINRKKAKNAAGNDITYTYGTYLVGVEGFDKSEGTPNELMPDNLPIGSQGYKIDIQNVGAAPDLTVNYVVNDVAATENIIYLPKNKIDTDTESEITINCTVEDTKEEVPEFQILLDEQSLGVSKTDLVKDTVNSNDDKFIYTFTRKIKLSQIPGFDTAHSKQHTITVTTSNGSPTSDKKTFMYDVEGPVVEIRSVTPVASIYDLESGEPTDSIKYLNGENIEISVSFADSFDVVDTSIRKPKIEFVQGNTVKTIADGITELSYKKTGVSTKMSGLTDGDVIIRVTAYDRAGNKTTKEESYKIDQTTDSPVIIYGDNSVNNSWSDISSNTPGRKNVFNMGGQFLLKLVDDDGLSSYSVYSVKTSNGSGSKADDPNPDTATINGKESQFAWTLPTEAGTHKVWLDVTDTERNTTSKEFFIKVVSGMPIVSIENERYVTTVTDAAALTNNASKSPLKIKLSIEASEGPFDIYMAEVTAQNADPAFTDATPIITNLAATEYIYNYPIDSNKADGEYKLKFFVVDNSGGNTGVKITSYKLDKTAPSISSVSFDGSATEKSWYKTVTMALSVEATDGNNAARSDISTVEYSLDNDSWTALTNRDGAYIRTVTFANGANTLYLRAIDNVGNIGTWSKNLKIDETAPEFGINTTDNYIYLNKTTATQPLVLYGRFKDEQSGVGELSVSINGQAATVKYYDGNDDAAPNTEASYKEYSSITDKTKIKFWRAEFTAAKLASAFPKDAQGKVTNPSQYLTISGSNKCEPAEPIPASAIPQITVMMDIDDPTFENIGLNSVTGKGVYKESSTSYFASTTLGTSFTLTGIAKDPISGVKQVDCTIDDVAQTPVKTAGWSFDITLAETDGLTKTVVVSVSDNAGNTYSYPAITVTVDNTAPTGLHKIDAKGKDIVFRIGNNDNDDIDESYTNPANGPVWTPSIDTDVGGKYANGTYGNAETIKIRGFFDDASGSGVDLIYYKVFTIQPDNDNKLAEKFLKDETTGKTYETQADGYFSLISPVEKRVFYTKTNTDNGVTTTTDWGGIQLGTGSKWYLDVKYNFYTTISGLSSQGNGENYLVFVAVDKVGNAALESVDVPGLGVMNNYKINVDQVPPAVPNDKIYAPTSFYNPSDSTAGNTFVVYGLAQDSAAGIRDASVKINGAELYGVYNKSTKITELFDKEDEATRTSYGSLTLTKEGTVNVTGATAINGTSLSDNTVLWKVELNQSAFTGIDSGSSASLSLKVTDSAGAGNSETYPIGNVMIDMDGPVVTIKSPAANSTVNGKVRLSVTASDGNGKGVSATAPKLYKKNGDNYDELSSTDHPYNSTAGEFTVDTTKFADNANVVLRVSFDDQLNNTGNSDDHTLAVNQDTDRPIIKMNQVKSDGSGYLTSKTVFGSVTDDDGTINKLWVWSKKLNSNTEPSAAPSTSDNGANWTVPDGWIEFGKEGTNSTLENNNWQIDSTEADGTTTWFWAVADADNSVFWTKGTTSPYITYSNVTKQTNTTGISFKYDTESPEINSVELLRLATNVYKTGTTRYAASEIAGYVTELGLEWSSANNIVFGKDYALMYAKVEVTEKTGMDSTTPLALDYITLGANDVYVTEPDSNNKYTYYLGPFDLHSNDTASPTLTITAKDAAGKTSSKEKAIVVDNIAEITISDISPAADEIASGKFTLRGQVSDAQSSVTKVEYYIPKYSESTDTTENTLATKSFTHITTATSIQFSIDFNNFNSDILKYTTNGTEVSVDSNFENYDIGDNVYQIPVWFKVTDSVGNIGYVTNIQITYDPNEDRPKVYITDPEISATPVEKGGRIKISGNAQDNEGIAAVYLQFDLDGNNTDNWTNSSTTGAVLIPGTTDVYGFKATNTKNWNYTLDVSSGITDETVIKVRAIAQDNDTGLLSAWTDVLKIKVNNSIPYLDGDMYLRQYSGNTVTVEKKYEPNMYVKGAWKLEGTISTPSSDYLSSMTITVDNGESKSSTWNRTGAGTGAFENSNNAAGVTISYKADSNDKSMNFSIPVSGSAKCEITIETTDNAPHTGTEKPEINIDNTPASFADYSDQANYKILLYQDSYGAGGTLLGSSNYVQNSNGAQFTLAGKIVEEQSGFDKAVFYFKRTGSDGVKRVYNPMEGHGTDNQANRTNIASSKANAITGTGGTIYIHTDDQLPVRPLTVVRGTTETAQNDEIKTNKNIRVGGLVYLGGLYRLITDINRTTGTVTFEPEAATSNTDAEFVYGLVVDHNGERDNGAGGVDFDDGDGLLESYSGSTTANFRWEATFNSANIPDGPIDIYVVTFDKAGNIGYGYLTTKASNNAPRITKVMLGTDLNGNNTFDYGTDEFTTFYAFTDKNGEANTTKGNAAWTLDTSAQLNSGKYWTAKNGIAVIPEFVGGAGPFYYVFDKGVVGEGQELKDKIKTTPSTFTYSNASSHILFASGENDKIKYNGANATWTYGTSTSGDNTGGSLILTNNNLVTTTGEYSKSNDTETNPAVVYTFTFWDSTEESTPGTDTGSTILNAYVRQDLTDDVVPNTVIKPFEWTGTGYTKNVSTVVNGGQPSVVADNIDALGANDKLGITKVINGTTVTTTTITPKNNLYGASKENGHIELEADLSDTLKALQTGNPATALGGDPKVSGKITIHGTSYDNTRLSSIWFKFDNFTAGGGITSGGDTGKTGTNGYTQAAYYNTATATWVPATATMASNNWDFTVTDTYFNQTGHKVDWYLSIDTSKITNVAGLDKILTVITLDSSAKVSTTTTSSSTDDAVNNVPTYQMDVVPYITKLYTGISDSAGDNLARSALGKYIVRADETVKMFGFNLATGTNNVKVSYASGDPTGITTTEPSENDITKYGSHIDVPIGSNAESGSVSITVNSVSSLNNVNKNPTFTSITDDTITSVPYNSQANSTTNNRLTDDVELWVWNMGYFLNETKPIYSPVMKMDASGNTYMAYGLGADQMILRENNTARIADYGYNKFVNTAVAYSSDGKAFGMGTCTDRIENHSASSVFYTWRDGNYKKVGGQNDAMGREYTYSSSSKYHLEKVYNNSTTIYDTDRVQRPKMEISGSSNGAKVYMVYYDHNNTISPIKFRYGVVSGTKQNELSTSLGLVGVTSTYNGYGVSLAENNNPDNGGGSGKNFHIVASSNTTFKSGPYTAVGYTSDGAAIVSWYDSSRKAVILSWNTSPASSTVGGDWQTNAVVIDDDYAGWYLNMCVDAADGIHLAYYNSSRGDLKYVYIPDYTEITKDTNSKVLTGATIVTVDSYLSVGTNISIGTRLEGEVYVPYIYYYNTSNNQTCNSVKVAWQKDLTTLRDGAINENFTGAWESMTIPTPNVPTDSLICGGVPTSGDYKDTVVLGYLSDEYYEKAYIKGNIK